MDWWCRGQRRTLLLFVLFFIWMSFNDFNLLLFFLCKWRLLFLIFIFRQINLTCSVFQLEFEQLLLHLYEFCLQVMSLVLRILLGHSVLHKRGNLLRRFTAFNGSILAERSQDFDHVSTVIDSIHQVFLMLTLNLKGQLLNFWGHFVNFFLLGLRLCIKSLFFGEIFRLESLIILRLGLELLQLSLTCRCLLEFARCCMFLLFCLNFKFSLLNLLKLIVSILNLGLNHSNLLFSMFLSTL